MDDVSLLSKTENLKVEFDKNLSEFELLKLCHRNLNNKKVEKSNQEIIIEEYKWNFCDMKFNTGTVLNVHIDLEHPTKPMNETKFKGKTTCYYLL